MDTDLYKAARDGALILTANDRLARSLLQQYDQAQQRNGLEVWLRPDIFSLSTWLARSQQAIPSRSVFLNNVQLQHVWENIVVEDLADTGRTLLQVPQTAKRALQAHQLLVSYAADFDTSLAADDHRAFLRWRQAWNDRSRLNNWHDPAALPWLIAKALGDGSVTLKGRVILAGYDETTPALQALCQAMKACGSPPVFWQAAPCRTTVRQKVPAQDAFDEVSLCARWARALLQKTPSANIGVIVPQLETYRPLVEQIFTSELTPQALFDGDISRSVFNLSLGQGLDREGVVFAALKFLCAGMQVSQEDVSWLLTSPYMSHVVSESNDRAQLDRELRRLRRYDWHLPKLLKILTGLADKFNLAVPGCLEFFNTLVNDQRRNARRLPGAWSEHFALLLGRLGWPGQRGLSSREYQAVEHFRGVLAQFASLDAVAKPLAREEAVRLLVRLVNAVEFQPEGAEATVQVLGELESGGLTFDHLWLLGLSDRALPKPPSPTPFIPLPIQRRYGMKRADAEREFQYAERIVKRLFWAAPEVIVSWPTTENGAEQRPSPFLLDIPVGQPVYAAPSGPDWIIWQKRPVLESLTDEQGPAISTTKPFAGGTGLIKDQALCPFRAFAHYRLRAEQLDVPDIGIDNMSRGTLAHAALECFWSDMGDQSALLALDEVTLKARIRTAVSTALERYEKERRCDLPNRQRHLESLRLAKMVHQWLELEKRRRPFRVAEIEKYHQVQVGGLVIRTRIDRIDTLDDDRLAIIDYKTGHPDPAQWLDNRVTEPQLPLYCLGLEQDRVGAVMFAEVRSRDNECGFRGLARSIESWPGASARKLASLLAARGWQNLDEVLSHWALTLPALGNEFACGLAAVDPVNDKQACQYCDLTGLCRVLERATLPRGGDDG